MNKRTAALALLLLVATMPLLAQGRMHPSMSPGSGTMMGGPALDAKSMSAAAMVSGKVTAVAASIITLTGDIRIDASQAKISGIEGRDSTLAAIKPGMLIVAMLSSGDANASGNLVASVIAIQSLADVSLTGAVTSVNAAASTFVVLGQTIHVSGETSFGGTKLGIATKFSDILAGTIVHVEANFPSGQLNATNVQIMSQMMQEGSYLRGTVQSITATEWTLSTEKTGVVTITITPQTKITGDPHVGDAVDVQFTRDAASKYVAVSIAKRVTSTPPPSTNRVTFTGTVKSISATQWVILVEGAEKSVLVNEQTKIMPGIVASDRVVVVAEKSEKGLVAISITRPMML